MSPELILQTARETGAITWCASYFDASLDRSLRVVVLGDDQAVVQSLRSALEQEFSTFSAPGGCGGSPGAGKLDQCRAKSRPTTEQVAVVAVGGGATPSPELENTLADFLTQPGAMAVGVLPASSSLDDLPPSARQFQAARFTTSVGDAAADLLAVIGLEPEERRAFISYSHNDERDALDLMNQLSERRFSVFLDSHRIPPGSLWEEVLRDGIVDAALLVVLETQASARSFWVRREIGIAIGRGAGVAAVHLSGPGFPIIGEAARYRRPNMSDAADFVIRQHRLQLSAARAQYARSIGLQLDSLGVSSTQSGRFVRAPKAIALVNPRPVGPRHLRIGDGAAAGQLALTLSPEPALRAKRDDRKWLKTATSVGIFAEGCLPELARSMRAGRLLP